MERINTATQMMHSYADDGLYGSLSMRLILLVDSLDLLLVSIR